MASDYAQSINWAIYTCKCYSLELLWRLAANESEQLHLFEMLPLEEISPSEVLKYVPKENAHQVFDLLAKEYYQLGFPGKALTVLREALQVRQLCSEQLTRLALDCEGRLLPEFHTLAEYF